MGDLGIHNAHAASVDQVLAAMQTHQRGLTKHEATERLRRFGSNRLPVAPSPTILRVFARQFLNPLIYILIVVGFISSTIGHLSDAGFILGILVLNALIGTAQEYGAEKGAVALRKIASSRTIVVRDDENFEINSNDLVIGDIVQLESGNKVPADLRLISSHGLEIDESLLTGESIAVQKDALASVAVDSSLGDRKTMAFAGTLVTRGRSEGIVVATGLKTKLGNIASAVLKGKSTKTPLLIRMERFTKKLAVMFSVAVIIVGSVLLARGYPFTELLLLAVALGVSAIPEGLPVALTVALAIASRRMARRKVIVRKLASVEALGSCTFIGTDKTGTLTVNELTAKTIFLPGLPLIAVSGTGVSPEGVVDLPLGASEATRTCLNQLLTVAVLCNEAVIAKRNGAWTAHGDAVDIALLVLGHKAGITAPVLRERYEQKGRIPFESELQFAATFDVDDHGSALISVKGALERVLPMCKTLSTGGKTAFLDRAAIETQASLLAAQGYRVLALASSETPAAMTQGPFEPSVLSDLSFLGLIGMIDPPRPEARSAIIASRSAGVEVAMITGDHPLTAFAIARELGLADAESEVVTGMALKSAKTEAEFDDLVRGCTVFARVEPNQKLQITQSLIRQGHYIAITGDGANDAPALKAAHVGVAMGKSGTDVAKETSDLIIADDRFSSIIAGIEEGRVAYANVRKVIYLLVSTGVGEIILFALSIATGYPMPLTAVQLLWLNIVTNGIQDVALAFEAKEGDELQRKPRPPEQPVFDKLMNERVLVSALVIGGVSYTVYAGLLGSGMDQTMIQNRILLLMVLFENIMVGNARSEMKLGLTISPFRNLPLLMGTVAAQAIHIGAMHFPPIGKVLGTSPVSLKEWITYLVLAISVFAAVEIHKLFWRFRHRGPLS